MFGILKKKVRKAAVEVKKMENRDAVEATVWAHMRLLMPTAPVTQKKSAFWKNHLRSALFLPVCWRDCPDERQYSLSLRSIPSLRKR